MKKTGLRALSIGGAALVGGILMTHAATAKPPPLTVTQHAETGSMPKAVTVSPDGKHLVVTNFGFWGKHNLYWYDPVTLKQIDETNFGGKGNAVESVFSPDSKLLYVSNFVENKLMVIDADTHAIVRSIETGLRPKIVILSADGSKVVVADWDSYAATIYDAKDLKLLYKLKANEHPRGMALTDKGKLYVAGFEGDELDVYDGVNFADHKKVKACKHVRHMSLSPDQKTLYLSCYYFGQLGVWDIAADKMQKLVYIGQEPKSSAVSDDGRYVFVASFGKPDQDTVSVVDTTDWSMRLVHVPKMDQGCGLAIAPDQTKLWVTGWNSRTLDTIDLTPLGLKPTVKASASASASIVAAPSPTAPASSWPWVPIAPVKVTTVAEPKPASSKI